MSDPQAEHRVPDELPRASVTRRRRMFPVVWVVPLIAALVAVYLVYDRVREFGPKITIRFKDGTGVRTGQTPIKYRGVTIGEVTTVELSENREQVLVTARLQRSAASIAKEGAIFWIVRPEVGFGSITGLRTVITGPEIQVLPGNGAAKSEFLGLDRAPISAEPEGLKLILRADRPRSLKPNTPVYYHGVEVGVVQTVELGPNADTADVHALIRQRYAVLVRSGSVFWNVSGASVSAGLFSGLQIKMESVRSMVTGGIEFATPNDPGARQVRDGTVFPLYGAARKEWLQWAPRIQIPAEK